MNDICGRTCGASSRRISFYPHGPDVARLATFTCASADALWRLFKARLFLSTRSRRCTSGYLHLCVCRRSVAPLQGASLLSTRSRRVSLTHEVRVRALGCEYCKPEGSRRVSLTHEVRVHTVWIEGCFWCGRASGHREGSQTCNVWERERNGENDGALKTHPEGGFPGEWG
jgi:hypothetical protein